MRGLFGSRLTKHGSDSLPGGGGVRDCKGWEFAGGGGVLCAPSVTMDIGLLAARHLPWS